jgi:LmbE family N-acetylglucosaminyl deacetylase
MLIKRRIVYASTAAALVILLIKNKLSIKTFQASEKAIENGLAILRNSNRILAISAHPDDLEFFAGGLLKLMNVRGHEVHIIDVTDGEKGVRVKNLAEIRREEQLAAGRVLGISNIHFLHLPDLKLEQINTLDNMIKQYIQEIKPDIILTFDYYKPIKVIIHPDHIKVGSSTTEAVKQLTYKKPYLLYYASREPNAIVDISDSIEDKIKAVQKHRSQIRFSTKPYGSFIKLFGRYSSLNTPIKYSESFRLESYKNE